jgi:hypothetical protein
LGLWCFGSGKYFLKAKPKGLEGPGSDPGFCVTFLGLAHGRGASAVRISFWRFGWSGEGSGILAPARPEVCGILVVPPSTVGLDRPPPVRGRSGSSPRSVLIKICANKKDR